MSLSQAARAIAGAMLLLALAEMPDDFYKALRLVVTAAAVFEIWCIQKSESSQNRKTAWTLCLGAVVVIFNPLLPLEMDRETWVFFDISGAAVFAGLSKSELKRIWLKIDEADSRLSAGDNRPNSQAVENKPPALKALSIFALTAVICFIAMTLILGIAFLSSLSRSDRPKQLSPVEVVTSDHFAEYSTIHQREASRVPQSTPTPEPEVRKALPAQDEVDGVEVRRALPAIHVVQEGENPYSIAKRYGISYSLLLSYNKIYSPQTVKEGDILKLPPSSP